MSTMVVMREKLETKVFLPEPVYKNMPMILFVIGVILLACAIYFFSSPFFLWAILYFASGMISCMFGVGLFVYRRSVRKP
ncbi:MAG: hypothetical protein ACN4GT_14705, partial [Gammaproteobacteria bacterium]